MGGWCKERYNKDQNNKLEGLYQKPDHMEETRWEGQNFSEVVAPQEEKEEEDTTNTAVMNLQVFFWNVLSIDA
jgi:hypothetical protein